MSIATQQLAAPIALPAPQQREPGHLRIKINLLDQDKRQFQALMEFYGVSEKHLAALAVRHFLNAAKERLPRFEL